MDCCQIMREKLPATKLDPIYAAVCFPVRPARNCSNSLPFLTVVKRCWLIQVFVDVFWVSWFVRRGVNLLFFVLVFCWSTFFVVVRFRGQWWWLNIMMSDAARHFAPRKGALTREIGGGRGPLRKIFFRELLKELETAPRGVTLW